VAYGLIAHHFDNKRGLYQAVLNEIAVEIAEHQLAPPPQGASLGLVRDLRRTPGKYIPKNPDDHSLRTI
jgi:AcrR family transcriptional regulator